MLQKPKAAAAKKADSSDEESSEEESEEEDKKAPKTPKQKVHIKPQMVLQWITVSFFALCAEL